MTPATSDPDLSALVGTWRGRGVADFPTIQRTAYRETLEIEWDAGRDVLVYDQRVVLDDGSSSHREHGFLRRLEDGQLQLWNAQDNGRAEVLRGRSETSAGGSIRIDLEGVGFLNDPRMLASSRTLELNGSELRYELSMETTTARGEGRLVHLSCTLRRDP